MWEIEIAIERLEQKRFAKLWSDTKDVLTENRESPLCVLELNNGSEIVCDNYIFDNSFVRLYNHDNYIGTVKISNVVDIY